MAKPTSLSRLIPKSIQVKTDDGSIVLAGNAEENKILNYLLAAQIRDLMEHTLKKYKDGEVRFTPREMKELAEAGRILAEFSAEVYKGGEGVPQDGEKQAEQVIEVAEVFKKEDEKK